MIDAVERYIAYNPLKWELRNNRRLLRLYEPLISPLFAGEYWRGVGAVGLLDRQDRHATEGGDAHDGDVLLGRSVSAATNFSQLSASKQRMVHLDGDPPRTPTTRPLVALRVSRQCDAQEIASLIARLKARASGFTLISGFVSPGERAIFEALLDNPLARLVKVSPTALAHDYQPPVRLMPAIADGRLAIVARGNSPEEISRATCLDLNARLVEMADFAAYQRHGHLDWIAK